MRMTFRPLLVWPHPPRPQRPDLFKATYSDTLSLLERELEYLGASDVILGVVADERDVRLDGQLRSGAKVRYPGVELSFDVPRRGRLVFFTDAYQRWADSWQSNLRAIALGLEALRAVDRYGITSTAEQYAGFLQLTTSQASPERGRELVEEAGGIRQALLRHHPDQGGDPRDFGDVQAYRQLQGASS